MCLVGMSPQVTQQPIALAQKSGVSSKTYPPYLLFLLLTSLRFPHSFLLPQTCTPIKHVVFVSAFGFNPNFIISC